MYGNWAFSWVQVMAHNKVLLSVLWSGISLLLISGIALLDQQVSNQAWGWLLLSVVLMSVALARWMDSIKSAFLQLLMSLYVGAMTLGALGWAGVALNESSLLGWVILMTLVTSNLIHILSSLLREMARGLFQFDALAEALKLNNTPVFLSNFTTLVGFMLAAWYEPELVPMSWVVVIGAIVSYLVVLTVLPMILLSWLLEFRVGHSADRMGYAFVVKWMQSAPHKVKMLMFVLTLLLMGLCWLQRDLLPWFSQIVWMVAGMWLLFAVFWQSLSLALLNTLANFLALTAAVLMFVLFVPAHPLSVLLIMMPLGLIVDDGIHFFSRYLRAKRGVFSDSESAVRYAMASVGRPIWMTSWTVMLGLFVLLLAGQGLIQQASLMTMLALVVATLMILFVVPAFLIMRKL
ncbi:MAG: MMPL family transporter [Thiomicrorhabdus chilensis]|uniref:MMPL family transporter n=1 Tax=Thiomicrorhabdus chilensis TaxID=63656 RepID=UPI00299E3FBC|nr:MMPL family transporter [Thiomicrorhabdus chilensis]MDX1348135.1 MMPL family transporter [Thiomicrorhabdus chilensis]